jgi:hypothetical protein
MLCVAWCKRHCQQQLCSKQCYWGKQDLQQHRQQLCAPLI